jgi:hypothetical protein
MLPPFDGYIEFSAGGYNPERNIPVGYFPSLGVPGFFLFREIDGSLEFRGSDAKPKFRVEKLDKAVEAMIWRLVGSIYEGIRAVDVIHIRCTIIEC